ncbi:MAG: hypothetical protein ABIS86_17230, partial [Streptosporangiaceae bacterium]
MLIDRSVLIVGARAEIGFRHQLLFEYVAAQALLERGGAAELDRLHGIVQSRTLDLFVGAVFEQALILAWRNYPTLHPDIRRVLVALSGSATTTLQSIALVVAAYHPQAGPEVGALLDRAPPEAVRRFVELTPRASGPQIGGTLSLLRRVWLRTETTCRIAVLNVLERFAARHGLAVQSFLTDQECIDHVARAGGDLLLSERALPRILGLLADTDADWSREGLRTLFDAGWGAARKRALAVAILEIVAERWDALGSAAPLAEFEAAVVLAQEHNDGQENGAVRLAVGRLYARQWTLDHALSCPEPDAEGWLGLVTVLRDELAAHAHASVRTQLRLMGVAQALAQMPEDGPVLAGTLAMIFPAAADTYGKSMYELSGSFLVFLLGSASPAGRATRELLRSALLGLPAPMSRTATGGQLLTIVAREAMTQAELSHSELAELLADLPSTARPDQWIDVGGLVPLIVRAALGGHPVAAAAWAEVVDNPGLIDGTVRKSVVFE